MKAGKLSETIWERSVHRQLKQQKTKAFGMDYGAVTLGGETAAVATAVRAFPFLPPEAGVYAALGKLVCSGAEPVGVSAALLLPTAASENTLRELVAALDAVCAREQLMLLGLDVQVLRTQTEPLLVATALGRAKEPLVAYGARPDMDIILTKWAGLEGTAALAVGQADVLRSRLAQPFLDRAAAFFSELSVCPEASAARFGASAMHALSEGGVFGALWELGQCSGVGLEIDLRKIPIRQETIEICEILHLNPYKLLSGGSLLIAAPNGNALLQELETAGVHAAVIGRTTEGNDRVLVNGEEKSFLERTQTDELWKIEKRSVS